METDYGTPVAHRFENRSIKGELSKDDIKHKTFECNKCEIRYTLHKVSKWRRNQNETVRLMLINLVAFWLQMIADVNNSSIKS